MSVNTPLKTTPLHAIHVRLGAKMVPFAGWDMPIQYKGVMDEHRTVRDGVGIFDVSHMGEVEVKGPQAKAFLQHLVTNDVEKMTDGGILYSLMCYENGGVVDDLLIHRFDDDHYFLCVNAANTDKDFDWIEQQTKGFDVTVENTSDQTAQLAVQGKHAEALLKPMLDIPVADIAYYTFQRGRIEGADCIISRTGYTGEDGFEIYLSVDDAAAVYEKIMEAGKQYDLQPIGLGARDTLRIEMGYPLYGQEIDAEHNPLEARLGFVIKLKKETDFVGKQALKKQKEAGLSRKLVAIKMKERGVPRSHYKILQDGRAVGEVTSGTFSPSLNTGVALCYVPTEMAQVGNEVSVEIRNQAVAAEIISLPMVPSNVKKN
ncbi:Aminomethyltransferase [Nitrospina gracilis 3/211]|uniref:Aminomethyltransferase n=1 Tax=Nitrospina gracilis (strain 3/211) TaxID=1266370 RepID=M1Z9X7_NITG3|nr:MULTISPECIES: glycine cleavage system aminomethyltransferase GcvT [Nitrospina]MCF8722388.1 aminomethyltransferase [Nitrospina sp. Nb-3]CCQ90002.1 Aminomethyltransferase [Nitrospina gracilis 3/211]